MIKEFNFPTKLYRQKDLKPASKLMLAYIGEHARRAAEQTGEYRITDLPNRVIANDTALSIRMVKNYISWLKDKGYLDWLIEYRDEQHSFHRELILTPKAVRVLFNIDILESNTIQF